MCPRRCVIWVRGADADLASGKESATWRVKGGEIRVQRITLIIKEKKTQIDKMITNIRSHEEEMTINKNAAVVVGDAVADDYMY